MLKTENVTYNGKEYIRTWSDKGMMLERDGALYEEAIDPVDSGRVYTETDTPVPVEEANESDYLTALNRLGVSADE
jgi:hypothetical protein